MRKTFCILLVLVICCLFVTALTTTEAEAVVPTTCAAGCENPQWEPLPASNWNLLDEGHYHYYLTGNDTKYRYTPKPGTVSNVSSGNAVTICLDLNGFNITTDGRSLGVYSGCVLNVMDSSTEKTGYVLGQSGSNNAVGGTIFNYGELNLYSGTLKYAYDGTGTNPTYAGGVISLGDTYPDATFNMHGGRLEGGEMVVSSSDRCYGGTIYAGKGNIGLYGGEVISGSVAAGKNGPCIYLSGAVDLTLSSNANVDNIYITSSSAKVNVSGTYSGKARITYGSSITPSNGKVIGTATNTPSITGDLLCTNGNGWLVNVDGSSLKLATFTPSAARHYCAHCKDVVYWSTLNTTTLKDVAGEYHMYLSSNYSGGQVQFVSGTKVCLDLYGKTWTTTGRALNLKSNVELNLMDTVGGSYVEATTGSNNPTGGVATMATGSVFNLYSGTLQLEKKYVAGMGVGTGGIVYMSSGSTMNVHGGTIQGADLVISEYDGITLNGLGAAFYMNGNTQLNVYGGHIKNGTLAEGCVGSCVYLTGSTAKVSVSGDAKVDEIYCKTEGDQLTVSGTYTGTVDLAYPETVTLEEGQVIGKAENADVSGAKITCGDEWLTAVSGSNLVLTANATAVYNDGTQTKGFATLQEAIGAYNGGSVKLMRSTTENITVSKDLQLDLNGKSIDGTVTVADGKTLYVKDSQTDDYTVSDGIYGKLTDSDNVVAQAGYLKVTEGEQVSFHKVEIRIDAMTLRSKEAGVFYESVFHGDEMVAEAVESFGVALSVQESPNETNMDTLCKYSTFTDFAAGKTGNPSSSTLLKNILKTENTSLINNRNLKMNVYGRPYIKTKDGYVFGNTVTRSLIQQLADVDSIVDTLTATQMYELEDMYVRFEALLSNCNLNNVVDMINDDTLSILMVGNSFCYYYVEELYGLLMANPDPNRGYTDVEIYNLYYSGCSLSQHYNWWVAGEANYELFRTNADGRKKLSPATGDAWKLEDALQQGRWDYISLQGKSSELNYGSAEVSDMCAQIIPLAEPLLAHFHELHPNAQLMWHRTWAFELGRVSGGVAYTEEALAAYDAGMQDVCDYMCNEFDKDKDYDLVMVNSGAAWVEARAQNALLETSLIPTEGGLCARKGIRNENTFPYYTGNANAGDGYHDGDIGGGQFLNACVWYEQLTGQSCLDNPYKPELTTGNKYELSEALLSLLRNAAHAVKPDNQ